MIPSSAKIAAIKERISELSGSGKRVAPAARMHGIYSSFTLPGLDDMLAVRNTRIRFDDFCVPQDLDQKTFIDVGCNVGAVSMEAARRGAQVVGVEYRLDRVELCRDIATAWGYSASFYQADFNDLHVDTWAERQYDYVLSCSVDEYIADRRGFYRLLHELCRPGGTLYLESNVQGGHPVEETMRVLESLTFRDVRYVGNGHSGGIARKRKLITARKAEP